MIAELEGQARSSGQSLAAVGVAVPGIVDESLGCVRQAVNLGIENLDLRALLQPLAADEIGHLDVGSGRECACGLVGCLETVSSARAISTVYAELSGEPMVDAATVVARAAMSDSAAITAWNGAVEGLARALAACFARYSARTLSSWRAGSAWQVRHSSIR